MITISRRKFLQGGAAAILAASLNRELWAFPPGFPPGIELYTVKDALQKDLIGTLRQLRAIGYEVAESYHFQGFSAVPVHEALEEVGLKCPAAHLSLNGPDLGPAFEEAHILGAHYAVSSTLRPGHPPHPGSANKKPGNGRHKKPEPLLTLDDFKKIAAKMNVIGRQAKQANLQYAYHNHNVEFRDLGNGKIGYDILLSETDPELVQFELDCGWMVVAGYSPVHYFKRYPNRYCSIHIKDFVKGSKISTSTRGETRPVGTELGRGMIDYKPIFAAARKAGVKYYFVEQEPPFLDMTSLEAAKVDYDYLRAL